MERIDKSFVTTRRSFMGLTAAVAASAVSLAFASGCSASGEGSYKIGVLQLVEHGALDEANRGFVDALKDAGIPEDAIEQQNAQNDQSACQTIASTFVNDGKDLIFAIGTPAAQAVAGATDEIPIVASAITDFTASGLVESDEEPGGNVTGTSDLNPVEEQIALIGQLIPDAKTVGILYCTAESNSAVQVEMANEACVDAGLTPAEYSVSSSNEIQQVTESMVGKVDVIYTPTDNPIAAGMNTVSMIANEAGIPTICGEENQVAAGGLISLSIDYYQLGYQAGEQAVAILEDEAEPATTPVAHMTADDCKLVYNQDVADELGIDPSVLEGAEPIE